MLISLDATTGTHLFYEKRDVTSAHLITLCRELLYSADLWCWRVSSIREHTCAHVM
jgi:hypothetical protein